MKKPQLILGIVVLVAGSLILIALLASRGDAVQKKAIDSVTVQKDGNTLTVSKDGSVRYETDRGVFEDFWDSEKVNTFYGYLGGKYTGPGSLVSGGENYIAINSGGGSTTYELGEDELIDAVEDETAGGGGPPSPTAPAGQGPGGGPTPTPGQGGSGAGFPTPTPYNPGGPDPECLYWRLSYCVRPRTPSPSPSATPAPVEIREPDCGDNTETGRTVIGNDLCISTPSPTPTP